MEYMEEWIRQVLQHPMYQYVGLFGLLMVGILLPLPDELILSLAGIAVYEGKLMLIPALLCAILGSWCGVTLSYVIGRTAGLAAVNKFLHVVHGSPERVEQLHRWFEKWGKWALAVGYWLPGIRHVTAIVAGVSTLRRREFCFYAYCGGTVWCVTYIMFGNFLGRQWVKMSEQVHDILLISSIVISVLVMAYLIAKRLRRYLRSRHAATGDADGARR